jgi:hypothetical protein
VSALERANGTYSLAVTETLSMRYCALISVACVLFVAVSTMAKTRFVLLVKEVELDQNQVVAGPLATKRYIGLLENTSTSSVLLEIIQMWRRHGANGKFRACYLERWEPTAHRWEYVPSPTLEAQGTEVRTISLEQGNPVEVCSAAISYNPKQPAACYRFTLRVQEKGAASPSTLLRTFAVGTRAITGPPSCPT